MFVNFILRKEKRREGKIIKIFQTPPNPYLWVYLFIYFIRGIWILSQNGRITRLGGMVRDEKLDILKYQKKSFQNKSHLFNLIYVSNKSNVGDTNYMLLIVKSLSARLLQKKLRERRREIGDWKLFCLIIDRYSQFKLCLI